MSEDKQTVGNDELLRSVFESAVDFAIFSTNPDGLVTSWNLGAERLLGFKEQEIVRRSADVIFTLEDRKNFARRGKARRLGGGPRRRRAVGKSERMGRRSGRPAC
jgi:PAS domain S-box-containing protein